MSLPPKLKRCPACDGKGYHDCAFCPSDCPCGMDHEPCEKCGGTGIIDPLNDYDLQDWGLEGETP